MGHTPSTAGTFRKKFRKNSGKTPETLSEHFLEFPSRVRLGCPKPYNSRRLRPPERFQNSLPPSTAGDASFFRIGSGEGLSELVMEFPAVLGAFLTKPLLYGWCPRIVQEDSLVPFMYFWGFGVLFLALELELYTFQILTVPSKLWSKAPRRRRSILQMDGGSGPLKRPALPSSRA